MLKNYVVRVVPRALFGERSLGGAGTDYTGDNATPLHITNLAAHDALIVCAWAVILVIVVLAVIRFTALVSLLRPRLQEGATRASVAVRWLPAAGFAALLLVAVTLNFRVTNGRTTSPAWTSVVATAHRACAMPGVSAYTFVHEWWFVTIPCSKVG
jgi:hypothetical protein